MAGVHGSTQAVFGLGNGAGTHGVNDQADLLASTRILAQIRSSVTTTVCEGVDEQDSQHPLLEGITTSDSVLSVVVVRKDEDGLLQEVKTRAAGDFVAGTDALVSTANLEDNQGNWYIVTWLNVA